MSIQKFLSHLKIFDFDIIYEEKVIKTEQIINEYRKSLLINNSWLFRFLYK